MKTDSVKQFLKKHYYFNKSNGPATTKEGETIYIALGSCRYNGSYHVQANSD